MRLAAIALVVLSISCSVSTSRPSFAPADDTEAPAGLDLSVVSVGQGSRVRVGLRSHEFGFIVWSPPIALR